MSMIPSSETNFHTFAPGEADESEAAPEEERTLPSVSSLDRGMPVEVMKDFDTVLFFGRMEVGSTEALAIGHIRGEKSFPVCQPDSPVLVRGYDARMEPVLLLGRVAYSSGLQCVVSGLKRIPYESQRKGVRYPLTPPASVCVMEEAKPSLPQPCELLNISPGGACIVAEQIYQVEQPLRLQVELVKEPRRTAAYDCKVVRATPRSGSHFEYGLLFTNMDEDSRSRLMQDIQTIYEETRRKLFP